jgi:hypothetical protein
VTLVPDASDKLDVSPVQRKLSLIEYESELCCQEETGMIYMDIPEPKQIPYWEKRGLSATTDANGNEIMVDPTASMAVLDVWVLALFPRAFDYVRRELKRCQEVGESFDRDTTYLWRLLQVAAKKLHKGVTDGDLSGSVILNSSVPLRQARTKSHLYIGEPFLHSDIHPEYLAYERTQRQSSRSRMLCTANGTKPLGSSSCQILGQRPRLCLRRQSQQKGGWC